MREEKGSVEGEESEEKSFDRNYDNIKPIRSLASLYTGTI